MDESTELTLPASRVENLDTANSSVDVQPRPGKRSRRLVWTVVRIAAFTVVSVRMAFPGLRRLGTHVVGNPGDAYLILALLRWGAQRSTSLYRGYWRGPMFAPERHVMAYSDTFLPLTLPFRAIEALTGSPVLAMNVLFIAGWMMCGECTYLLLARLTRSRSASVVGALAFAFSTVRLAQADHFQLVFAFFIPLSLLSLIRLFDAPTARGGVLLGLSLSGQFLVASYYGVILIPVVAGTAAAWLVLDRRTRSIRQLLVGLAATAGTIIVILLPVGYHYVRAETETGGRDWYPWFLTFQLGDLIAAHPASKHLGGLDLLQATAHTEQSGNFAYVGWFVLLMLPALLVLIVASAETRKSVWQVRRELFAINALALLGLGIAAGRWRFLGIELPVYDIARAVIPGVRSMIAIARLTVFVQLALVVAATLGFAAILRHVRWRALRVATAALACMLVLYESEIDVPNTRVPVVEDGSVYAILEGLADEGVVAELPIVPPSEPFVQAFLESSRMVLGSADDHRTVNGHSGHMPLSYESTTADLNGFPSAASIDVLRGADVRYVVLRTAPVDTGTDWISEMVNGSGYAFFSKGELDAILASMPSGLITDRWDAIDGVVLELASNS